MLMSKQNPIRRLAASKIRDFSDRLLAVLKLERTLAAGGPALQHDVRRERVVARTQGWNTVHPIPDGKPGGVRSEGAKAADRRGPRNDGQTQ